MAEVRLRQSWYTTLTRIKTKVDAFDKDAVTQGEIQAELESTENVWKKLNVPHEALLKSATDDAAVTVQLDAIEPMETCYNSIKSTLYDLREKVKKVKSHPNLKLPEMSLPVFDGKYEDWPTFQDLFIASVERNTSLSSSQKLQYLKSCTKGEAASIIKSFTITDANYKEAWQLLEEQYDNQREIISSHVKKLLFQPAIKTESASSLQQLLTTTMERLHSLKVLGRPTDQWDDILTVVIIEKLDVETKTEWARSLRGSSPPSLKDVQEFIQQHIRTLHAKGANKFSSSKPQQQHGNQRTKLNIHHSSFGTCHHCKGMHNMYQCVILKDMPYDKRYAAIKSTGVCLNCLQKGHSVKDCQSTGTCKKCNKKHNTFIHLDKQTPQPFNSSSQSCDTRSINEQNSSSSSSSVVRINTSSFSSKSPTLLKTALVDVMDNANIKRTLRVFIDEGAEGGLIRESLIHQLGMRKEKVNVTVTGVGDIPAMQSRWKTFIKLHSQVNNSSVDVELYAVPKVTGRINRLDPGHPRDWSHIAGLQLADSHFHEGGIIDIIVGTDTAPYLLLPGLRKADRSKPVAQETIFGWVLSGNVGSPDHSTIKINTFRCEISEALRRFWEIEEVPKGPTLTMEEEACERHFLSTHYRQADGRYVVRLPFNERKHLLGESRSQAHRRLLSLERRFRKEPNNKAAYIKFMREYESLGHMRKAPNEVNKPKFTFYLPHHYVVKEDSTTTKQRTVFDGSAKSTTGVSLNDILMVGPTVQPDLYTLLLQFRLFIIALKADFARFYRQFEVVEEERDCQRILWREDDNLPVQEYQLNTLTYGTGPAAYLATRCLKQLAIDEGKYYPAAAKAITSSTYVDDFLGSRKTAAEAITLVHQLIAIASKGGMEIRKWCSSNQEVLQSIPEHLREEENLLDLDDSNQVSSIKALGIKWQPSPDEFMFSVNVDSSQNITKRYILSEISKTFDPLGLITPITINAKLLLQRVWLAGSNWDDVISPQIQQDWEDYVQNLMEVKKVRIPRCVILSETTRIELHGYSDSSELAYSCAIYIKCVYIDGSISSNLMTSRTRVAPLKCVSLPKMELLGAELLAKTIEAVQKSLDFPFELYCWTDSTITLRWVTSQSRRWKTFVATRVSTIQHIVPPCHWHHVRSEDNPADLPSRGVSTQQLINSDLWWHGPRWLKEETYPITTQPYDEEEEKKEEKSKQLAYFHLKINSTYTTLFNAFSSLHKLCRCTVIFRRFIHYLKGNKIKVNDAPITSSDIIISKLILIKWVQSVSFYQEINQLQRGESISSTSKLLSLNPFLDSNGILRVGGRIINAELPENCKHPIILPHNQQLTELIIRDIHLTHLHSGFSLTFAAVRREYWVVRGRDTVRHIIRKCIICRRATAATTHQLMGNLPSGRVTANRTFLHTGVDYAGPFQVKLKKGRHFAVEKAYFCIFVCLSTKAVHLEAVSSLSSEAFIACFERFVSRRGISAFVYSDCGTNFVGADKQLAQFLQQQQSSLQKHFASQGTTWRFNVPSAPSQGGLWESGVKSVKYHFRRTVGSRTLTLEQFQTLLCKIEACLNSRPLCALSSDPSDIDALTPGHFLIGEPLTNIPEPDVAMVSENRLSFWEQVRQMTQHFWQRWSNEYLTSLQQRHKWKVQRDNVQVGDLVVVADDQMPVAKWKLGRIVAAHPGSDNLVRSATVKTITGELRRPVTKLSPLISVTD